MEVTFVEKVVWLSNFCGYLIEENSLHGSGQFEEEVNQDYDAMRRIKTLMDMRNDLVGRR